MKDTWSRTVLWLGHYQFAVFVVYIIPAIVRNVVDGAGWHTYHVLTGLRILGFVLLALLMFVYFYAIPYHGRNLCLRDVREAPVLDPQGEIDQRSGHLRRWHWLQDTPSRILVVFAVLLFPQLIITTIQAMAGFGASRTLNLVGAGMYVTQAVACVYLQWVAYMHSKLSPWCPFCRRRGDGEEYFEPVDPTQPTGKREPRPV